MLIIAWEVTGACNLSCTYCRAAAVSAPEADELTTVEALSFIDEVAPMDPMLILSGGEPLLRPDILHLAGHAASKGLRVSLATNGTLLTPQVVEGIAASGISRISVSLDGALPKTNDATRGRGAHHRAMKGIESIGGRIEFQVNMTITRRNEGEVLAMLDLAEGLGARALHLFFLVPAGRGREEELIAPERQERLLNSILEESGRRSMEVQVTCAPQYARLSRARPGKKGSGGCLAGTSFVFLSRRGEVYPCGYLPLLAGSIRRQGFPEIWEGSEVLRALRERELKGRCGACTYRQACGGCRARAYAQSGDCLASDPQCTFEVS